MQPADAPPHRTLLLSLGLVAAGIVGFEVALTRIIAIQHLHHLASVIIALGLLGFGAAGAFASLFADTIRRHGAAWLTVSAAGFTLALPISVVVSGRIDMTLPALAWRPEELVGFGLYVACFLPAFFLGALFVTTCFICWSARIGQLYAADLIGSAAGALSVPLALHVMALENLLILLSLAAAIAVVLARASALNRAIGVGLVGILAAIYNLNVLLVQPAEYKELSVQLNTRDAQILWERDTPDTRLTVLEAPGLHGAPGLSIASTANAPPQARLFSDGDGGTPLLDVATPPPLMQSVISSAAFHLAPPQPTVLLHSLGGGWQAWVATSHDPERIQASEENAALRRLLTGAAATVLARPYLPVGVELVPMTARRFHAAHSGKFDVVMLTLSAPEAGLAAGTVSYDTTVEAFREVLADVSETGVYAIVTDIKAMPQHSLRLAATATRALRELGKPPSGHIAAIRDWRNLVLLVTQAPINENRQRALRAFAERWRFDLVALPGLQETDTNRFHHRRNGGLYAPFKALLEGEATTFQENYAFDVRPTTDDSPFFDKFFRHQGLATLRESFGPTWRAHLSWGYLLHWAALLIGTGLALTAVIAPLAFIRRDTMHVNRARRLPTGLYFSALGLGFMFVEIGLLQKSTLLLDATSSAFSIVVAAMLVGAGMGSYWLGRRRLTNRALVGWLLLPAGLAPLFMGLFAHGFQIAADWPFAARAGFISAAVFAIAFPMGCALPQGMLRVRAAGESTIAWAWGINGFTSVIGSLAAVLIAMHWGFTVLMGCASICYLAAAILGSRLADPPGRTAAV
ncbi:hypothetical protein EHN06_15315 [Marinobacter sp. NP-4(2019)]|uniref:hypothetical protein n=1 Tax=Marinobacter sp. NP-4(2019) TaxID=2488665 RepID=UPI000FC3CE29|nr:hypothetical protein [Marinobacter sp. NP-4(2019)]AZT84810.1 hypothetical protein EHN06_15315 [Marinobacter sp. NP-4(2019)]